MYATASINFLYNSNYKKMVKNLTKIITKKIQNKLTYFGDAKETRNYFLLTRAFVTML